MEIGKKIRKYRMQNELTLEELASRSELSKGFLSQIENDITSPSIATLNDIVEVLGVDLSTFFKDDKETKITFNENDFFVDEKEEMTVNWIVPNSNNNVMEPILLELQKGQSSFEISPYEGEEFGYILEGEVNLIFGDNDYTLQDGETFYFKGDRTHYLKNKSNKVAKILWLSTPPIF